MTRRLAASLQKKFGPILTSQKFFPTLGPGLRMRLLRPKFGALQVCDLTLANDSQGCRESAEKVWADSNKPGNFLTLGPCLRIRLLRPRLRKTRGT